MKNEKSEKSRDLSKDIEGYESDLNCRSAGSLFKAHLVGIRPFQKFYDTKSSISFVFSLLSSLSFFFKW